MKSYKTILNPNLIDIGLVIYRIAISCLMLTHGYPKMLKFFGGEPIEFADPFGLGMETTFMLAVFAEFFCAILIIIGYITRLAAVPIVITMATAALIVHQADPFAKQELPLLYLFAFLLLFFTGAGRYSLDYFIQTKK
ncbi:DoxX family protein [Christiangramia sabulilitoris]|uniref:DoxX family protein n=1 Tax=Christiangramia sabulilitoris TaxID=2583991 RepID=A0A550I6B2_9FLAO|nr:DoxX family protein [Christiangramia sabulilitoris]TRO66509.1 DoxX family protein [Christiangramia sabulilitoris]